MNKGFEFINENGRRIVKGHGHYEAYLRFQLQRTG
jgi:5-formyltetrahydrofolate cyclo-ligase